MLLMIKMILSHCVDKEGEEKEKPGLTKQGGEEGGGIQINAVSQARVNSGRAALNLSATMPNSVFPSGRERVFCSQAGPRHFNGITSISLSSNTDVSIGASILATLKYCHAGPRCPCRVMGATTIELPGNFAMVINHWPAGFLPCSLTLQAKW